MKTGTKANKNGKGFENYITLPFSSKGFITVHYSDWHKNMNSYGKEVLICDYPYYDITKSKSRMEYFVLSDKYGLKCRIECKWQSARGSVDEKLAKLYLDCIEPGNPDHTVIVVDGGGQRERYVKWIKDAARRKLYTSSFNSHKRVDVMGLVEFITWVNNLPEYVGESVFSSIVMQNHIFDIIG